jgi:putative ABC transport system permease protein
MDEIPSMKPRRFSMQVRPILAALRRHKVSVTLIVLQIALTLAVVCNALFIVQTRIVHLSRPTGVDEANLFVIKNEWIGKLDVPQVDAQMRADLTALRNVPGVRDAFASEAYPLEGGGGALAVIKHHPEQPKRSGLALSYFADQHAIETLGIKLQEGRNFRADEIGSSGPFDKMAPAVVIITRDLASKLFPDGSALGKTIYLADGPTAIIGIVEALQGPYAGSTTRSIDEDSILVPSRRADPAGTVYLVRVSPGQMDAAMRAAAAALWTQNRMRLINPDGGLTTLAQAREQGYAIDRGVALMMGVVCSMLLLATAGGIVGLSSFWVSQRRRHIGVRRALGATSGDIQRYFQTENFLIVSMGIALGMVLGYAANLLLMTQYELPGLPFYVMPLGALVLWLLGQIAVYGPARYAAAVPPVVAIRS